MNNRELCIRRIDGVRALAGDPELAYAARTRLHRAILACTRLVASRAELQAPLYPGKYDVAPDASPELKRLCETSNRLVERSRIIGQPSEPLDGRWSDAWSELLAELDELEARLLEV